MHGISEQQRSEMFKQLAAMEEAGIPPDHALKAIAGSGAGELASNAEQAARLVCRGYAIGEAGRRSGLLTTLETKLLNVVIKAGSPAPAYRRLADFYEQRVRHRRAIRSRLMLPSIMLLAAIFLAPLPGLFTGTLGFGAYLSQTLGIILIIASGIITLLKLPALLRDGWLKRLNPGDVFDRLLLHAPLFGRAEVRRHRTYFLRVLCLLLESGIPLLDALPLAAASVTNGYLRDNFSSLVDVLESGESLASAFRHSPYMDDSASFVTATGEATGESGQVICRYAEMEQERLDRFYRELQTWIPRLLYLVVVALMAWQIIAAFPGPAAYD